jgi:hypothetical protein
MAIAACGASDRRKAVATSLAALEGARAGFEAYDHHQQNRILDTAKNFEEGQQRTAAYRARRAGVLEAFMAAYSALTIATLEPSLANLGEATRYAREVYDHVKALKDAGGP